MADTRIYLVDGRLRLVPSGVPGEILIGGDHLARGYWNLPGPTAQSFVADGFAHEPGRRLYATGDRARTGGDGVIEFLGRKDHQVKIRGVRVEPGEIEAVLLRQSPVRDAAVAVRDGRVVSFLVAPELRDGGDGSAGASLPAALAEPLRASLPEVMLPAACAVVEALPRLANGKLDRAALDRDADSILNRWRATVDAARLLPRTPVERRLAGIWREVLSLRGEAPAAIGVEEDFFELGGHSLLATQVVSRMRSAFGVDVPLRALFRHPTIAGLAEHLVLLRLADVEESALESVLAEVEQLSDADVTVGMASGEGDA